MQRPEAVLSRILAQETERSPVWQCILLEERVARRESAFRASLQEFGFYISVL